MGKSTLVNNSRLLSRGDRRMGRSLYEAYNHGGNLSAWRKSDEEMGMDIGFYLYRERVLMKFCHGHI